MARRNAQSDTPSVGSSLPDDVAQQYQMVEGVVAKFYCSEFGHVDLTKIDLEFAEQLAKAGYLIKKP